MSAASSSRPRFESVTLLAILFTALAAWESFSRSGLIPPLLFPPPSRVAATLAELLVSGELATHLSATLRRVVLGLAIGGLAGVALGLLMGWSRRLRAICDPLVGALHPIPKIALLPLIMIALGIGDRSRVAVVAIATFFPMLLNTMGGVRQINPIYFEVAELFGAGAMKTLTRVLVPGSLPQMLVGLRIALNLSLTLTIAVEIATAQTGLGAMVWLAWQTLRTEDLFAAIVVTAALGVLASTLVGAISSRFVSWEVERQK